MPGKLSAENSEKLARIAAHLILDHKISPTVARSTSEYQIQFEIHLSVPAEHFVGSRTSATKVEYTA